MPNAVEAMAYTGTDTPPRRVYALADRVPVAIVTNGATAPSASTARTGEEVARPGAARSGARRDRCRRRVRRGPARRHARRVAARAADVVRGLCPSLALQQYGGSLAAPGWGDIVDWWRGSCDAADESRTTARSVAASRFLDEIVPRVPSGACRRAAATIARQADVAQP